MHEDKMEWITVMLVMWYHMHSMIYKVSGGTGLSYIYIYQLVAQHSSSKSLLYRSVAPILSSSNISFLTFLGFVLW